MGEFANEAQARCNEAHRVAYKNTLLPLQPELLQSSLLNLTEVMTVHAGFRTDFANRIANSTLEIRSNQNTQESTLLDIQELLKMILEQQQRTNMLLESLANNNK